MISRAAAITLCFLAGAAGACVITGAAGAGAEPAKPPAPVEKAAPASDPRAVVTTIYKLTIAGLKKSDASSPFFDAAARKAYFSRDFDHLITTSEAAATRDGSAMIDFDPITNSQDPTLRKATVKTERTEAGKATVSAHFVNLGHPTVVTYDLVEEDGGWKIDEIRGAVDKEPWSVRKILTMADAPDPAPAAKSADKAPPAEKPAPKPR